MTEKNELYYGDNLDVLRLHVADDSVDLVYLDPPFNSDRNYNILFEERDGTESAAQIKIFGDTWRWDQGAAAAYDEVVLGGGPVSDVMQAFRTFLGTTDMLAYLSMMAPRLIELKRVMKPTGSLYLHCDPTASHYLKLLLDAIFGADHYRNEIVWQRTSSHNDPSRYGRIHDVLLFYTKGDEYTWNQQYDPLEESSFESHDFETDEEGRQFRKRDLTAPAHGTESGQYTWKGRTPPKGRMWSYTEDNMKRLEAEGRVVYTRTGMPRLKIFVEDLKGLPYQDVWARSDLWLNAAAQERLGYPTQKPMALLERVIRSSSSDGDVVLDPFCGCGTTIEAASALQRRWIGIDITHLAITLIKNRIKDAYQDKVKYEVIGEPTSLSGAKELAETDKYQFQWWALGLVGARPTDQKKGADKGIDGKLLFHDGTGSGKAHSAIFSVKAGKLKASEVRDLVGTVAREKAEIGVLISYEKPTGKMRTEAASHGFYTSVWGKHAKIQLITVEELLNGKAVDMPQVTGINKTFKVAKKAAPSTTTSKREKEKHPELFDD